VVDHARAVTYRVLEISRAARSLTPANKRRMKKSYKKLLALTRRVVRESGKVIHRWQKGKLPVMGSWLSVETQMARLRYFVPLVEKVIQQTNERVFHGNRRTPGKILSLFEPHSQVIRKGKAHKPNEFGRLVRLDEVENGIVSGYEVLQGNAADSHSFTPAVENHKALFGRAPKLPLPTGVSSPPRMSVMRKSWA
jgi:transposase, IS5 family